MSIALFVRSSALPVFALLLSVHASGQIDPLIGTEDRIRQYRTSPIRIVVSGFDEQPCYGAQIHVVQQKHTFLFGAGALSLMKHTTPDSEARYQQLFGGLFNFATVLTYWQDLEKTGPTPDYGLLDKQVQRLREMGIAIKGHPLILAGAAPSWAGQDIAITRKHTERRIGELTKRYAGSIGLWDVVGDATSAGNARTGLGAWARAEGPSKMTDVAFKWARHSNRKSKLVYNEYNLDQALHTLLSDLNKAKSPVDVVGLEAHMGAPNWPLDRIWSLSNDYAKHNIPLHWSELTVLSGIKSPTGNWQVTAESEKAQADYVEKLYTLLFSHPAVKGIGWWNPVDGDWDTIPGGLIRADLTPKPAYDRLKKLLHGRWWTDELLETGSTGEVALRGFHGSYLVEVTWNGRTLVKRVEVEPGKPTFVRIEM